MSEPAAVPGPWTDGGLRARFGLSGRVALITGGAGLLGAQHAQAIAEMGGAPIVLDCDGPRAQAVAAQCEAEYGVGALGLSTDIRRPDSVSKALSTVLERFGRVDILINNAAHNPTPGHPGENGAASSRLESFAMSRWNEELAVGLTGAFLCSQIIGQEMARQGAGVILNIASDLSVIAPDQRIYRQPGVAEAAQPVKPITYSVVKHGLIGLTRYLATYWAAQGVRVNALSPGGVYAGQDDGFVTRLTGLIPMGRMAAVDEYKAAVIFLVSDASSYMTGANVIVDGGRTVW